MTTYDSERPANYVIEVAPRLDPRWSQWFDGMHLDSHRDDRTRLVGYLEDQAALHGVLTQIRDLGLEVISVLRIDPDETRRCVDPGS